VWAARPLEPRRRPATRRVRALEETCKGRNFRAKEGFLRMRSPERKHKAEFDTQSELLRSNTSPVFRPGRSGPLILPRMHLHRGIKSESHGLREIELEKRGAELNRSG